MKLIAVSTLIWSLPLVSRLDKYVKKLNSYFMQFMGFFLAVLKLDIQMRHHKGDGID